LFSDRPRQSRPALPGSQIDGVGSVQSSWPFMSLHVFMVDSDLSVLHSLDAIALSEIDHGIVPDRSITDDGFPSSLIEESRQ
jgi:hypothetical protein